MSVELPQDGEAQGELLIRGPWITGKYYNLPAEQQEGKFYDGWLVTGDIASIDTEGYLIIRDRSKDLIKSGEGGQPIHHQSHMQPCSRYDGNHAATVCHHVMYRWRMDLVRGP